MSIHYVICMKYNFVEYHQIPNVQYMCFNHHSRSNIQENLDKRMHSPYAAKRSRTSNLPQNNTTQAAAASFAARFPPSSGNNPTLDEQRMYQRVLSGYQVLYDSHDLLSACLPLCVCVCERTYSIYRHRLDALFVCIVTSGKWYKNNCQR